MSASLLTKVEVDYLSSNKWPTKMLALLHPFGFDDILDENLEQFFGLTLPFLDFRPGIQGIEEAFTFFISKEDEDFHENDKSGAKILNLMKVSQYINENKSFQKGEEILPEDELGRFYQSEVWKIS